MSRMKQEPAKASRKEERDRPRKGIPGLIDSTVTSTIEDLKAIIEEQPEDATHEEIVRELVFAGMVRRGLEDARQGRLVSDEEMGRRIQLWQR